MRPLSTLFDIFLHFTFLLFRNLLMNVGIIQPVQICILTNLIIKWNHHRTTLDKSHSRCSIGYESKLPYTNRECCVKCLRTKLTPYSYDHSSQIKRGPNRSLSFPTHVGNLLCPLKNYIAFCIIHHIGTSHIPDRISLL